MEKYVKVQPDSQKFKVEKNDFYKVYLEQPAEHGKANNELIRRLKQILGQKPGIVSGHNSRRKRIKVDIDEEKFENKMRSQIDG